MSGYTRLGWRYHVGDGVEIDYHQAKRYYLMDASDPVAQNNIGLLYENGLGEGKNYTRAMDYYLLAAKQGYSIAQCSLGRLYEGGLGVPQDYTKAMEQYTKAANQGYSIAQYNIGVMHELGRGVAQDYTEAMKWYQLAANQGVSEAQTRLALLSTHNTATAPPPATSLIATAATTVMAVARSIAALVPSVNSSPVSEDWQCQSHESRQHDFFINYRVATDRDFAQALASKINGSKSISGVQMTAFFDKECLPFGVDWQVSFLNGLMSAKVIVLLISNAAIEGIKHAHQRQDNVLLEYEYAFQRLDEEGPKKKVVIFPIFLGIKESITHKEKQRFIYSDFEFPAVTDFPNEIHKVTNPCHIPKKGTKTIRDVMRRLFNIQGKKVRDFSEVPPDLISDLRKKLAQCK